MTSASRAPSGASRAPSRAPPSDLASCNPLISLPLEPSRAGRAGRAGLIPPPRASRAGEGGTGAKGIFRVISGTKSGKARLARLAKKVRREINGIAILEPGSGARLARDLPGSGARLASRSQQAAVGTQAVQQMRRQSLGWANVGADIQLSRVLSATCARIRDGQARSASRSIFEISPRRPADTVPCA